MTPGDVAAFACHTRWHARRAVVSATCPWCTPSAPRPATETRVFAVAARIRRRPYRHAKLKVALAEKDVDVLRLLVARIEAVDSHAHAPFVERTMLLTRFCHELLGDETREASHPNRARPLN